MGEVRRDFSLDFGGSDLDLLLGSSSSSSSSSSSRTGAAGCSSIGSGAPRAAPSPVITSSTITCLTGFPAPAVAESPTEPSLME